MKYYVNHCRMAVVLALLSLLSLPAYSGNEVAAKGVMIQSAWSRPLPPVSVNGAAYVSLHNMGPEADRLIGGRSDIAGQVMVHDHLMENGQMKMVHMEDGLPLPTGEMVELKPGGKHLMLMGLTRPLVEGESFELILQFEHAGEKMITVGISEKGAMQGHSGHSS